MKRKYRIIGLLGLEVAGALCVVVLSLVIRPRVPLGQTGSQITSVEVRQIQKAVDHDRWAIARSLAFRHQFSRAFEVCTSSSIQKIDAKHRPKASPEGHLIFVNGVSVECKPAFGRAPLTYELEPTTNGHWKIAMVAFPKPLKTSNNRVQRTPL
jgi:hypothetical protein